MKLYMHPASTTCRPIMMFIADNKMKVDQQVVDIMTGEQYQPAFAGINPSCAVPVLEDGSFRMTESSAILKYLADKIDSPTYPKDLQKRARVNEMMDWLNTGFYRTFGYDLCYRQLLDGYKMKSDTAQSEALAAGKAAAERFLGILDKNLLGGKQPYLCGDELTIADYFGSGLVSLGEVTGCKFANYPNIQSWYERMRKQPSWKDANAGVFFWADAAKGPAYVAV
jgi:glutathione S-transferase